MLSANLVGCEIIGWGLDWIEAGGFRCPNVTLRLVTLVAVCDAEVETEGWFAGNLVGCELRGWALSLTAAGGFCCPNVTLGVVT